MNKVHIPNFSRLEIDITAVCGYGCPNCDRLTSLLPVDAQSILSPAQLERDVVNPTVANNQHWELLNILGGEPTTHPEIETIVRMLMQLFPHYTNEVRLSSHGATTHAMNTLHRLKQAFPDLQINNTNKQTPLQIFDVITRAPIDRNSDADFSSGCWVTSTCGIAYSWKGFYTCATGLALARVFPDITPAKTVDELRTRWKDALRDSCRYCGRFGDEPRESARTVSPTWDAALRRMNLPQL